MESDKDDESKQRQDVGDDGGVGAVADIFGLRPRCSAETMKSESGMELFHLRQASEMYGYSIEWNDMERSVTLVHMDKMDDKMMGDGSMMKDDKMMMPAGKMIKLWIDSKEMMIDGMKVTLDTAPAIYDGSTYVVKALITKYMKPAMTMN